MDVIKLNIADLHDVLWMKGSRYDQFRTKSSQVWFMQALEIDPPKLNTDSRRYQFQATVIDAWSERIQFFSNGLQKIATDLFARTKSGYIPDVPFAISCLDDMPVVVRDLNKYICFNVIPNCQTRPYPVFSICQYFHHRVWAKQATEEDVRKRKDQLSRTGKSHRPRNGSVSTRSSAYEWQQPANWSWSQYGY